MALASFLWPKVNIYFTLESSFVTLRTLDLQRPLVLLLKVLLLAASMTTSTFRVICSNPVCEGLLVWPSHGFLGIWCPPLSSSSSAQRRSTHPAHQRDCPAAAPTTDLKHSFTGKLIQEPHWGLLSDTHLVSLNTFYAKCCFSR